MAAVSDLSLSFSQLKLINLLEYHEKISLQKIVEQAFCDIEESSDPRSLKNGYGTEITSGRRLLIKWDSEKKELSLVIITDNLLGSGTDTRYFTGIALTFSKDSSEEKTREYVAVAISNNHDETYKNDQKKMFDTIDNLLKANPKALLKQPPPFLYSAYYQKNHIHSQSWLAWTEHLFFSKDMTKITKSMKVHDAQGNQHPFKKRDLVSAIQKLFHTLKEVLHKNNLVHGDVKPSNLFPEFQDGLTIRFGDFGGLQKIGNAFNMKEIKGAHQYSYWDLICRQGIFLPTSDLFGFVATVAMCLTNNYKYIEDVLARLPRTTIMMGGSDVEKTCTNLMNFMIEKEKAMLQRLCQEKEQPLVEELCRAPEARKWEILKTELEIDSIYERIERDLQALYDKALA